VTAAWSFSAGKRASAKRPSSKVRVYERDDVPGRIFMTRAWITTESGRPVEDVLEIGTSREYAETLAELTAKKRELALLEGKAGPIAAEEEALTLKSLLDAYHDSRTAEDWSNSHARNQATCKAFWLGVLGEDFVVDREHPSPGQAERLARQARDRNGWSPRTEEKYLRYLHAAARWAWRKERMIGANPLLGLETPDYEQDTTALVYSLEEIARLVRPHPDVDWRLTLACAIAYDTGRRRSAIAPLRSDGIETVDVDGEEVTFIEFEGAHDKARRTSWVAVSSATAELIRGALERKSVTRGGWLLPGGHEGHSGKLAENPITPSGLSQLLREAEDALEIEHVTDRGFHGIKRMHVTELFEITAGDVEKVMDTTGNVTPTILRRIYRQRRRESTAPSAEALRGRLPEPKED